MEGNAVFHMISMMLHLLRMNGMFGGQPTEDAYLHLKNFIEACDLFEIANISQESIWLRLFLLSLKGDVVLWLCTKYSNGTFFFR